LRRCWNLKRKSDDIDKEIQLCKAYLNALEIFQPNRKKTYEKGFVRAKLMTLEKIKEETGDEDVRQHD